MGTVTDPISPDCRDCQTAPRAGRSFYCSTCRDARRSARKAETQRARRAAARTDPGIETLLTNLRQAAKTLATYLDQQQTKATAAGTTLNTVQQTALDLTNQSLTLSDLVQQRGLKPPRTPNLDGSN